MESPTGEGMVAGSIVALVAELVRRRGGEAAVDELLAVAGHGRTAEEIADIARWTPFGEAMELFEVGAALIEEPELGRLVGEEMFLQYKGTELAALLRALGSPGELLRNVARSATKFTTSRILEVAELGEDRAVITSVVVGDARPHPMMCGFAMGLLSQASALFGMEDAEVVEVTCERRGDDRCTYDVRWDPDTAPDADPLRRIAHLEEEVTTIRARFEALQATATGLVEAEDVAQVLREIISRAGFAIRATQYVLAVRLTPSEPVRVEHRGYDGTGPSDELVEELLEEVPDTVGGSRLIVDVATRRQRFGRLAALCPPGSHFFPEERRLLEAYAANAAAALEAAAALDEANRRHQTARALLELARALAEVDTLAGVAQRLAEVVPPLIGAQRASVLLWDEDAGSLAFRGYVGLPLTITDALDEVRVTPADTPALSVMLADGEPLFIDTDSEDPFLRSLLELSETSHAVVVPIATQERFHGVVAAALPDSRIEDDADLLERLSAVTSQGATALENARLLEQVHHQGLHDPLSGLPNRRLFRERLNRALDRARRTDAQSPALIFLDLDHFKQLNDSFGHEAGDKVIMAVAERMRRAVRATDTVARLGGDEFAVVLENLSSPAADARRVADNLLEAVRQPLVAVGRTIRISASAGAVVAGPGDDHDSLLRRADARMYEAKSIGRDRVVAEGRSAG